MNSPDKLADNRKRLTAVDKKIVELIAQRQEIVKEIGRTKKTEGRALRDFKRERVVFETARKRATELGINPRLVEDVVRTLIQYSLENQERDFVSQSNKGAGKSVLIIGGNGQMGQWFSEMFKSQGFVVYIADPSAEASSSTFPNWQEAGLDYDVIVVATPISTTNDVLLELNEVHPRALIFEVGSLKTPSRVGLRKLAESGCKIASLHPMFGPDTQLLSGRHLIFVDAGSAEATTEAKELFSDTMVEQIDMELDDHDRLIAFVLGLSHALNIVFFHALENSGESAAHLMKLSSSTFDAQLLLSAAVARENPNMYFEIQRLNEFGSSALDALCNSANLVRDLVTDGERERFINLMQDGQKYFRPSSQAE